MKWKGRKGRVIWSGWDRSEGWRGKGYEMGEEGEVSGSYRSCMVS